MSKVVLSLEAPLPIGPYSQAIKVPPNLVFLSGQVPIDPKTKKIEATDIKGQTRQVLDNLKSVVQAAGGQMSNIVKTTVLLADMNLFGEMNAVYGEYFSVEPPARSTFAVKGLPLSALVEIEAIAAL
ncbi:MAG: putative reactive intermediate/imine deaminase [Streblomastix strix]|uniref:Putative reactive intermediate/imine deaminase n=2 Tax=Streblomastix strix TaxID=222440 RepID=A0A5J4WY41_9EUKA|nr:MAG: putative reactive intermediate/imine deaminase [Streblomastix strix]